MYRFKNVPQGEGAINFLDFLLATNAAAKQDEEPAVFAAPAFLGVLTDRSVEDYPEATIIGQIPGDPDDTVFVFARTERAAKYMAIAAEQIGYVEYKP